MITAEDIFRLHFLSIEDFGGAHGVRDEEMLLSAIERPFQTFDGKDLYKTAIEKAAALGESLIINHPFVDGNKRIGMLAMLALLKVYHVDFKANEIDMYECIIAISMGEMRHEDIVIWLKSRCK